MRILTRGLESLSEAIATSGDVSLSSSVYHGGSHSLHTNAPGTNVAWAKFGRVDGSAFDLATLYARFWIRLAAVPASGSEEIFAVESAAGYKLFCRVQVARRMILYRSDGTTSMQLCNTVLALNQWYRLEFMVGRESVDGTGNGPWAIRIDGNPEASGTGIIGAANSAFVRLGAVVNRSANNLDCYFDDLAIDDADWPGATEPAAANLAAISQYYRRLRCS